MYRRGDEGAESDEDQVWTWTSGGGGGTGPGPVPEPAADAAADWPDQRPVPVLELAGGTALARA
ncbi:MAG TPA: hypothetical protein VLM84_00295, partial [Chromatiaceae bacterium]|nr:hypothetical protein [Chromatiaceae bacterium]